MILILLGITLSVSTIIYNEPTCNTENIEISEQALKLSKVSARIHIDNNWTEVKTAGICTGDGTYTNPYVIEDLIIDAEGSESGIFIENTNEFFKIENVTIFSALNGSGIKLYYVNNGRLSNNNFSSNRFGIQFLSSHNNTILGNIITNNSGNGMDIWLSNNNTIKGNIVYNNHRNGFWACGSGNIIVENNASQNQVGMLLNNMNYDLVSKNIVNNNSKTGIHIYYSGNMRISENTINYNDYGIILEESDNNTIIDNTANNNSVYGMKLDYGCSYNEISENIIHNNRQGLKFYGSYYNTLYLNNINSETSNILYVDSVNNWNSKKKMVYTYKGKNFTNYLGNYWSDYNGVDANNDGIGDTPYMIGEDKDKYPLMDSIDNYIVIKIVERSKERIPGYNLILLFGILSVGILLLPKRSKNS